MDYSHALVALVERIDKVDDQQIVDKDKVIRDRFKEGVQDERLVAWLKQRVRDYPDKSFRELRDESIKYSADISKTGSNRVKSSQEALCSSICSAEHKETYKQIEALQQGQKTLLEMMQEQ